MAEQWYYRLMGGEFGPVPSTTLSEKVARGEIQRDTWVRGEHSEWILADQVSGLFDSDQRTARTSAAGLERPLDAPAHYEGPVKQVAPEPVRANLSRTVPSWRSRIVVSGAVLVPLLIVGGYHIISRSLDLRVRQDTVGPCHRAAKELEGVLEVGVNLAAYQGRVQELAAEVAVLRGKRPSAKERELLNEYEDVLAIHHFAAKLWTFDIQHRSDLQKLIEWHSSQLMADESTRNSTTRNQQVLSSYVVSLWRGLIPLWPSTSIEVRPRASVAYTDSSYSAYALRKEMDRLQMDYTNERDLVVACGLSTREVSGFQCSEPEPWQKLWQSATERIAKMDELVN